MITRIHQSDFVCTCQVHGLYSQLLVMPCPPGSPRACQGLDFRFTNKPPSPSDSSHLVHPHFAVLMYDLYYANYGCFQFTIQLAVCGFAEFVLHLTRMNPDMMYLHRDSGFLNIAYFKLDIDDQTGMDTTFLYYLGYKKILIIIIK